METSSRRKGYWENQKGMVSIYQFLVFLCEKMFWSSAICQEEISESLEGVFPDGVINRGNKSF